MSIMMNLSEIVVVLNILLTVLLVYVYLGNFVKFRSAFTLGLFMFASLFFIQNVVLLYFFVTMMPYYSVGVEIYAFVLSVIQMIAFFILNVITWR